jgi:hypothetical protein
LHFSKGERRWYERIPSGIKKVKKEFQSGIEPDDFFELLEAETGQSKSENIKSPSFAQRCQQMNC